jgi:hypothetical protein
MKKKIKKLHVVHKYYPNVPRRFGKSTYCYDSLLRCAQTGAYKNLCYVTNTYKASEDSLNDFMEFLDDCGERYTVSSKGVIMLLDCIITFCGKDFKDRGFDGFIEDYFEDDLSELGIISDWCKKQEYKKEFLNVIQVLARKKE